MTTRWHRVADGGIPDRALLRVVTESGDERSLFHSGGLLWLPDKSMYVYFTPVFWRLLCDEHEPVPHRDGREPWCHHCGLNVNGETAASITPRPDPKATREAMGHIIAAETGDTR